MALLISKKRFDKLQDRELSAWTSLLASETLSAGLFMHPEFCAAAHQTLGPVDVVVFEDQGRVVGLLPLNRAPGMHGLMRGYTQVAQDVSDGFGFLVEDRYLDGVGAALTKAGVWSSFYTHFATGKHISDAQFGSVTKTYLVRCQGKDKDMWGQLKDRSRKFWSDTERCARRLNELPSGYEFYWQSPKPERDIEALIDLKLDQYTRTGMSNSALFRENVQAFLKILSTKKTQGYSAPLSVLYCGERLVAAHLGLLSGERLHYWFPVYEPNYAKYSPGKVLLSEVMKFCGSQGVKVIDFGEGQADYKVAVATETRELTKLVMAPGARGSLSMLPLRWSWRMNRQV